MKNSNYSGGFLSPAQILGILIDFVNASFNSSSSKVSAICKSEDVFFSIALQAENLHTLLKEQFSKIIIIQAKEQNLTKTSTSILAKTKFEIHGFLKTSPSTTGVILVNFETEFDNAGRVISLLCS